MLGTVGPASRRVLRSPSFRPRPVVPCHGACHRTMKNAAFARSDERCTNHGVCTGGLPNRIICERLLRFRTMVGTILIQDACNLHFPFGLFSESYGQPAAGLHVWRRATSCARGKDLERPKWCKSVEAQTLLCTTSVVMPIWNDA